MAKPEQHPVWTTEDNALAYTCGFAASLFEGRPLAYTPQATNFAPQLSAEEDFVAFGPFARWTFDAPGDGSHHTDNGASVMYASTSTAQVVGFGLGHAAASGLMNRRARKRAEADAQERWMYGDEGMIHVSTHGFYLSPANNRPLAWSWGSVNQIDLVGRHRFVMFGDAETGDRVQWMIQSPFAELITVSWAWVCNRRHPSLQRGSWLPPHWLAWAVAQQRLRPDHARSIAEWTHFTVGEIGQ